MDRKNLNIRPDDVVRCEQHDCAEIALSAHHNPGPRTRWRWPAQSKSAPTHLATCFYERIKINGGRMSLLAADFARLAEPVIDAVHRSTPEGQRPDANRLAGLLHDTLDAAGVEVTIEPYPSHVASLDIRFTELNSLNPEMNPPTTASSVFTQPRPEADLSRPCEYLPA